MEQLPLSDFQQMDQLSLQKVPFFFMVDFLKQNIVVIEEKEFSKSGLKFDFQNDTSTTKEHDFTKDFYFKSYPEPFETYQKGFENVQENIRKGNSYLVNYTSKTKIETSLSLKEIYENVKSKYKILFPEKFVCFSPETFIKIENDKISTFPMKGTADASLPNAEEILRNDPKELAEHYTVVDLLRNDLSIAADNVTVDRFQFIDLIKTNRKNLFAMSSEISGKLKPEFRGKIGSILNLLLPAGSILGAPKKKTLEIISESENYLRDWYTGVCGWFDGAHLDSCVMIRFIEQDGENLYFKSGGGITHRSKAEDEYREMISKIYVSVY